MSGIFGGLVRSGLIDRVAGFATCEPNSALLLVVRLFYLGFFYVFSEDGGLVGGVSVVGGMVGLLEGLMEMCQ